MIGHPSSPMTAETFRTYGESLKPARLTQRRSLDDLSSSLKIHKRHLEAIEAGDISALPQGPYVKAFVREYARSLGVALPTELAPPPPPPPRQPKDPNVTATVGGKPVEEITAIAKEIPRLANTAVKSAVKTVTRTTENVVDFVETGSKEALEMLTSRELWDEAEDVRRERHGLPPLPRKVEEPPKKIVEPEAPKERTAPKQEQIFADETAPTSKASSRRATNVVIVLLALCFAAAAYYVIRQNRTDMGSGANKDYIPAPIEKPQYTPPVKHDKPAATTEPTVAIPPVKDSLRFVLRATDPVWVSIAPDGLPAYRGEMKKGETRAFKAAQEFVVNLGNQKAVQMQFNGTALSGLPTIQNSGVVVRNLVLTRDKVTLGGAAVDFAKLTTAPPPPAKPATQQSSKAVANITPASNPNAPAKKPWISPLNPNAPKSSKQTGSKQQSHSQSSSKQNSAQMNSGHTNTSQQKGSQQGPKTKKQKSLNTPLAPIQLMPEPVPARP